jgi:uncharacterized membrane protein YfcA
VDASQIMLEVLGGALVGLSLGLMGAGGAILSIPIFTLVLGHAIVVAKIEALAVTAAIAVFSATRAAIARNVDLPRFAAFAVPGFIGAWLGGPIAKMTPPLAQASLFGALALVAAWRMMVSQKGSDSTELPKLTPRSIALAAATGLVIGILTSVIGVGGGFLLVPALVLFANLPVKRAAGTSLLVIAVNSGVGVAASGFYQRDAFDLVDWNAVSIVAACGVVGSLVGARFAARLPAAVLRRIFAVVLVLVALVVVLKESGLLPSGA